MVACAVAGDVAPSLLVDRLILRPVRSVYETHLPCLPRGLLLGPDRSGHDPLALVSILRRLARTGTATTASGSTSPTPALSLVLLPGCVDHRAAGGEEHAEAEDGFREGGELAVQRGPGLRRAVGGEGGGLGKARRDLVERGGGGEVGEAGAFGGRLAVEAGAGCLGGELVGVTPEGRKLGRACSRGRAVGAQDRGGHVGGLAGRPAGVVDGLGQLGGELGDGGGGLAHGADQGAAVGHRVRDRVGRDQEAPPLAGGGGRAACSVAW